MADYRTILKEVRRKKKITASKLIESLDVHVNQSHYSRVENGNGHIGVDQYFNVCKSLGLDPIKTFEHGKAIESEEDININKVHVGDIPLESIAMTDESMAGGSRFSIYKGSIVWFEPSDSAPSNSLVIVADDQNNKTVRELILDLGKVTLKPWNNDYETVELAEPLRIVGVVKDINYNIN